MKERGIEMDCFTWPVRVYYEDTDVGGVVYHANYLRFMERARTEWLRGLGFEQDVLMRAGILFAVRSAELDFRRPGYFNQRLEVSVAVAACSHASLMFEQEVRVVEGGQTLCGGRVRIACLDAQTLRPRRIPPDLYSEINRDA